MLRNEFKFAFRRLVKQPRYTVINLIGLTLGISFSFLIYVFVDRENSYDLHIPDHELIYRVSADFEVNGQPNLFSNAPRPMGYALVEEFPEIVSATKFMGFNGLEVHTGYLKKDEDRILSKHLFAVDSNFLEIFQPRMLVGTYASLDEPNTIVLSESVARKLFGSSEAVGNNLVLEDKQVVEVTGIFADHVQDTHLPYEALISYRTFYATNASEKWWYGGHVYTYIKTTEQFSLAQFEQGWHDFFLKYMKTTFDELNGYAKVDLQPLIDLHLSPEYIWEPYPHGSAENLKVLTIIGVILIVIACFNYANLGVSQSLYRRDEVSIRKILGSSRMHLLRQHMISSLLLSLLAGLLSMSLLICFLPFFNYLTGDELKIDFIQDPLLVVLLLGFSLIAGLIAGLYPAVFEASLGLQLKKAKNPVLNHGLFFRRSFVVIQLVISIGLMIFTLVVLDQVNFVKQADMGFEPEGLVMVKLDKRDRDKMKTFQSELSSLSGVLETSTIEETPSQGANEFSFHMQKKTGEYVIEPSQTITVGDDFVSTFQLKLLAGRTFEKRDHEYQGLIINSYLAARLGYTPEEAVGANAKFDLDEPPRKIIGVVDDFRFGSLQEPAQSMTIGYFSDLSSYLLVRTAPRNQQETLRLMEQLWYRSDTYFPFQYSFIQDEFDMLLSKEDRLYKLLVCASLLAIFISCLGLFGLVTHAISKRMKEVTVRKILGANVVQLYHLIASEFLLSYAVALLLGLSAAWYLSAMWLEAYAFRTTFHWMNVLIAGVAGIVVILLTLSFHIVQAISVNPADKLRYE